MERHVLPGAEQGNAVWIDRAASSEKIHNSTPESDSVKVWTPPTGTNYSKQIWAPELHFLAGKWYIYVAASDGNNSTHRMQVLERDAADPVWRIRLQGQDCRGDRPLGDRWHGVRMARRDVFRLVRLAWLDGWPAESVHRPDGNAMEPQHRPRVVEHAQLTAWEKYGLPINEGPEALIHDGTLNIIYSASGYWTNQYALGRLTYNGTGSILSASSWTKASQPVFQATSLVTGTGHASFTKSPDGTRRLDRLPRAREPDDVQRRPRDPNSAFHVQQQRDAEFRPAGAAGAVARCAIGRSRSRAANCSRRLSSRRTRQQL